MAFTQGHALLIGVGTYEDPGITDVPVTVEDANAIEAVLKNANLCGYPESQVKVIHDAEATKQGILDELDELAKRVGENDTVFLFYAGHGALGEDSNYYLVSHDARVKDDRVVNGTGVSEGELLEKLHALKARRALMIFNACFSGNISPTLALDDGTPSLTTSNPDDGTLAALLRTGQGRIIITACREQQKSHIGSGTLTIFTQALVDGLRGKGVTGKRGFISVYDLYEAIYETVSTTVKETKKQDQEPELTVNKGVGSLAVCLYKGASTLDVFDENEMAPSTGKVSQVATATSERIFRQKVQIFQQEVKQSGGVNFGQGNTFQGPVAGGDQENYDLRDSRGTYVGGGVNTGGGDFTGRDSIVHGDKYNITIGGTIDLDKLMMQLANRSKPELPKIQEAIRLDVATPVTVMVKQVFEIGVAIRQPQSPPLAVDDLTQVTSEEGEIYRRDEEDIIEYRVGVSSPDCEIPKPEHRFRLRAGMDSPVHYFQLTPKRIGQISIVVDAYQEEDLVVASTRVRVQATVAVVNPGMETTDLSAGDVNFGQGNTFQGSVAGRDQNNIDARNSQGLVINPQSLTQNFGKSSRDEQYAIALNWDRKTRLRGFDLSERNMSSLDLHGADMQDANLMGANLNGANLMEANLKRANLLGTDLDEANLSGANLEKVVLREKILPKIDMSGAILTNADLSEAYLFAANLSKANLEGAKLEQARLERAKLENANLKRADLHGANLSNANLSNANLYGANLSEANLSEANLLGADLLYADLSKANFQRAIYDGNTTWPTEFHFQSSGAIGPEADLVGADLSSIWLEGADLSGADLSGADLSRANLSKANLNGSNLSEANLDGADLDGSDLSGADLSGVGSFIRSYVHLKGAHYTRLTIWPEGFDPESHGAILVEI